MSRLLAAALTLTASAATLLLAAPDAGAAPAPVVSPPTIQPGGSFTVSGSGCWDPAVDPLSDVDVQWIVIVSTAVGSGWADTTDSAGGPWSVTVQADPAFTQGTGSVEALCRLSNDQTFAYPKVWVNVGRPAPQLPPPPAPPAAPPAAVPVAPRSTPSTPAPPTGAPADTTPLPPVLPPAPTHVAAAECADCGAIEDGKSLEAGQQLSLSYTGFQPGEQVSLVMHSTPVELGTFTADAGGVVTADFTIPLSAGSGAHTFTFSGPATGEHVVGFRLVATEEKESAPAPEPRGLGLLLPVAVGIAALGLLGGIVLTLWQRRADARHGPGNDGPAPAQETVVPMAEPTA